MICFFFIPSGAHLGHTAWCQPVLHSWDTPSQTCSSVTLCRLRSRVRAPGNCSQHPKAPRLFSVVPQHWHHCQLLPAQSLAVITVNTPGLSHSPSCPKFCISGSGPTCCPVKQHLGRITVRGQALEWPTKTGHNKESWAHWNLTIQTQGRITLCMSLLSTNVKNTPLSPQRVIPATQQLHPDHRATGFPADLAEKYSRINSSPYASDYCINPPCQPPVSCTTWLPNAIHNRSCTDTTLEINR